LAIQYVTGEEMLISLARILIADSPTSIKRATSGTAKRTPKDIEVNLARFSNYLLPFLERYESDLFICLQTTICDSCDEKIDIDEDHRTEAPRFFHCSTCADGDYDICAACFASGKRCPETQHHMTEMRPPGILVRGRESLIARLRDMKLGEGKGEAFETKAINAATGRCFFATSKGFLGLGPRSMQRGDIVAVLFGGRVPFILRSMDGHFRLVGECYVHGIMDGEVVQMWKDGELSESEFELR
jgi:hypothetical protein